MFTIKLLQNRWLTFLRFRNDLSIIEMMLLFSQKEISNHWQQYEKVILLEEHKIWRFPNPENNAEACTLLHNIIFCLLENQSRSHIVDQISKNNGWAEQWCLQALKYNIFKINEYEYIASILEDRGFLPDSEKILDSMVSVYQSTKLNEYLIKALTRNKQYSKAIFYQKINLTRTKHHKIERHMDALGSFIDLLIQRDGQYSYNVKDIELAQSLNYQYSSHNKSQYKQYQTLINEKLTLYKFNSLSSPGATSQLLGGLQRLRAE